MEEEIWEHLARHLELLAISHTVVFLFIADSIFQTFWLSLSLQLYLIFFLRGDEGRGLFLTSHPYMFDFATSHFESSMIQLFVSSLFPPPLFVTVFFWFLPAPYVYHLFYFYLFLSYSCFPLLYSMAGFF